MKKLMILLALAPAGCIDLSQDYPDKRFYVLEAERAGAAKVAPEDSILKVRRFQVTQRYEGSEMVYRQTDREYDSDFYNVFFVPPASIFTEQGLKWMRASGLFEHVVTAGSHVESTHILEGSVTSLYGDYRDEASRKAVMEIEFFLLGDHGDFPEIIFHKRYRREMDLKDDAVDTLVAGWDAALAEILASAEADMDKVDRSVPGDE